MTVTTVERHHNTGCVIRLEGIAKRYLMGGVTIGALRGVDLEIARNE